MTSYRACRYFWVNVLILTIDPMNVCLNSKFFRINIEIIHSFSMAMQEILARNPVSYECMKYEHRRTNNSLFVYVCIHTHTCARAHVSVCYQKLSALYTKPLTVIYMRLEIYANTVS